MFSFPLATEHLGDSIRDWLERRPRGRGADSPQAGRPSEHLKKGQDSTRQTLAEAVGLGRSGHHVLIVFGTYCVILEELKGTDQPLIEI